MTIRDTICHNDARSSIIAYLATHDDAVRAARIAVYMELMHYVERHTTHVMLWRLAGAGVVKRVQRGWYRGGWGIV